MKNKLSIVYLMLAGVTLYVIHDQVLKHLMPNFYFQTRTVYLYFTSCSLIIYMILYATKLKNLDYVGYMFLLVTFLKMLVSYLFFKHYVLINNSDVKLIKMNYFAVFFMFLILETILACNILNIPLPKTEKQQ